MKALIHVANVLFLLSYLVRDILWLRLLSVIAGVLLIVYFGTQTPVMREPIVWNLVFLALNGFQIWRLILERRPVTLPDAELALYQLAFRVLSLREFVRLMKIGAYSDAKPGDQLVAQGEVLGRVMALVEGRLGVEVDGRRVAELGPGRLVGEMSFLTGAPTSARVVALDRARLVVWEKDALRTLLDADAGLRASMQAVIGKDLVAKLRAA